MEVWYKLVRAVRGRVGTGLKLGGRSNKERWLKGGGSLRGRVLYIAGFDDAGMQLGICRPSSTKMATLC